jgi:hypothetical protein
MASPPTPSFTSESLAAANGLNALAATTLWGALLGPYLYPLGASLGLWHELSRASSSCGDDPADFTMTGVGAVVGIALGAAIIGLQLRYRRGQAFGAIAATALPRCLLRSFRSSGLIWTRHRRN